MPISPSPPVSVTMSTSSEKIFASGVTISSFIVAAIFIGRVAVSATHYLGTATRRPSRSRFFDFFNSTLHIEILFGHVVVLAVQNFLEAADGFGDGHLFARPAGEHLRHGERLAQEAL